jgi:hypothetical protein
MVNVSSNRAPKGTNRWRVLSADARHRNAGMSVAPYIQFRSVPRDQREVGA